MSSEVYVHGHYKLTVVGEKVHHRFPLAPIGCLLLSSVRHWTLNYMDHYLGLGQYFL